MSDPRSSLDRRRSASAADQANRGSASAVWLLPKFIVSGGQTGVDRAALDVAIDLGIPHRGWCPAGRRAEDGAIPEQYQLHETASSEYRERTARNVADADATLVLYRGAITGGTRLTVRLVRQYGKACLSVDLAHRDQGPDVERVRHWLDDLRPETLNIAGPRESGAPGIGDQVRNFLIRVFRNAG